MEAEKDALQQSKLAEEETKPRGRPPLNGVGRMPAKEGMARYVEKIKNAGGNTYTVRIKSPELVRMLSVLRGQMGLRSNTAALTWLVEKALLEMSMKAPGEPSHAPSSEDSADNV
jgi:hypothetical protein